LFVACEGFGLEQEAGWQVAFMIKIKLFVYTWQLKLLFFISNYYRNIAINGIDQD